jgi:hypothetical protein
MRKTTNIFGPAGKFWPIRRITAARIFPPMRVQVGARRATADAFALPKPPPRAAKATSTAVGVPL